MNKFSKKNNDGKSFEKLVAMLSEAIKQYPTTKIIHDIKIPDEIGIKRQIDVLILEAIFENNGKETIRRIVIECKDHNGSIDIGYIDAFHGKFDTIKDIYHKIIVSKKGFSENAQKKAKHLGISLYQLDTLDENTVFSWIHSINTMEMFGKMIIEIPFKIEFFAEDEQFFPSNKKKIKFYLDSNKKINEINMPKFVEWYVNKNRLIIGNLALTLAISEMPLDLPKIQKIPPLSLSMKDFYVKGKNNEKIFINKIIVAISVIIDEKPILIEGKDVRRYQNILTKETKAEISTLNIQNLKLQVVKNEKNNQVSFFLLHKDGEYKQLQELAKYNSKTKKWEFKN